VRELRIIEARSEQEIAAAQELFLEYAEALGEARWLQQSAVYREDAFEGPVLAEDRGRILAQAGEADAALDEIQRLLRRPSWLSVHTLRLDPRWDPIRDHPRFRALLRR